MDNQYVTPAGYKKWSVGFMIAGLLTLIFGSCIFKSCRGFSWR